MLLAIDTATRRAGVAIGDAAGLVGEIGLGAAGLTSPPRHTEQLAPAIEYLTRETGVALAALDGIAISIGPGMFTGLRVGVVTAKALGVALGVPLVPVPTLDLVAWPLRHAREQQIVSLLDARRSEVYWARYRPVPGGVQREQDDAISPPDEVAAELVATGETVLLAGDGAQRFASVFADNDRAHLAGPSHAAPNLAALVSLATAALDRGQGVRPADIVPRYLRRSDAELAREARS